MTLARYVRGLVAFSAFVIPFLASQLSTTLASEGQPAINSDEFWFSIEFSGTVTFPAPEIAVANTRSADRLATWKEQSHTGFQRHIGTLTSAESSALYAFLLRHPEVVSDSRAQPLPDGCFLLRCEFDGERSEHHLQPLDQQDWQALLRLCFPSQAKIVVLPLAREMHLWQRRN
jgi:hypothetical protein